MNNYGHDSLHDVSETLKKYTSLHSYPILFTKKIIVSFFNAIESKPLKSLTYLTFPLFNCDELDEKAFLIQLLFVKITSKKFKDLCLRLE